MFSSFTWLVYKNYQKLGMVFSPFIHSSFTFLSLLSLRQNALLATAWSYTAIIVTVPASAPDPPRHPEDWELNQWLTIFLLSCWILPLRVPVLRSFTWTIWLMKFMRETGHNYESLRWIKDLMRSAGLGILSTKFSNQIFFLSILLFGCLKMRLTQQIISPVSSILTSALFVNPCTWL